MKPWLAKTLLGSAIALVVFAGLWMLLDSKWSGDVEKQRARWVANGWPTRADELLPPIDPTEDAGPIYREVDHDWSHWDSSEDSVAAVNRAFHLWNSELRFRIEDWGASEEQDLAYLDAPELERIRSSMHAASEKPHCRLRTSDNQRGSCFPLFFLLEMPECCLLPSALRAARHGETDLAWMPLESAVALSAHLREDPRLFSFTLSRRLARHSLETLAALLARIPISADHARRLLAGVQRLHPERDALRALDGERVLSAEPNWDMILAGQFPYGVSMPSDLADSLKLRILRPWRLLDEDRYFEIEERLRSQLATRPWEALPELKIPVIFPFTRIMTSTNEMHGRWMLGDRHARDLAEIALRLALARAESGSYPLVLDALGELPHEPLTNQPYVFTRAGEGYTLGLPAGVRDESQSAPWSVLR